MATTMATGKTLVRVMVTMGNASTGEVLARATAELRRAI
jgi:hypothetical protein